MTRIMKALFFVLIVATFMVPQKARGEEKTYKVPIQSVKDQLTNIAEGKVSRLDLQSALKNQFSKKDRLVVNTYGLDLTPDVAKKLLSRSYLIVILQGGKFIIQK